MANGTELEEIIGVTTIELYFLVPWFVAIIIGYISSVILLLTHLCQFLCTCHERSSHSKMLASYYLSYLLLNAVVLLGFPSIALYRYKNFWNFIYVYLMFTRLFTILATSLDTYLYIKRSVENLHISKGCGNGGLTIFSIFAWSFSLLLASISRMEDTYVDLRTLLMCGILTSIQAISFGLFFRSASNIRSANITNRGLKNKLLIHICLLLVCSSGHVLSAAGALFFAWFQGKWIYFLIFTLTLDAYEGLSVGFFYTFKRGVLEGENSAESSECTGTKNEDCSNGLALASNFVTDTKMIG